MLLCFTDLDGTLLNHDDYGYDAAVPLIQQLQQAGVPLIPTTSKTRAEVVDLRNALGLKDPFIVENGSGILMEPNDHRFAMEVGAIADEVPIPLLLTQDPSSHSNALQIITLGINYAEARAGLRTLSEDIEETLQGFGDLDEAALMAATQLSAEELQRACDRQFSEPFLRPQTDLSQLQAAAARRGYKILLGNRFCHLLGIGAAKGRAVKLLRQAWIAAQAEHHPGKPVTTLGLGDSPNDLSMLEAVDVAVVVPGEQGPHPELLPHIERHGWQVAPRRGAEGWAAAVGEIAENFGVFSG